jgi:hypothetical protein
MPTKPREEEDELPETMFNDMLSDDGFNNLISGLADPGERQRRVGAASDYIADQAEDEFQRQGVIPVTEESRQRRVGAASDYIADQVEDDLGDATSTALGGVSPPTGMAEDVEFAVPEAQDVSELSMFGIRPERQGRDGITTMSFDPVDVDEEAARYATSDSVPEDSEGALASMTGDEVSTATGDDGVPTMTFPVMDVDQEAARYAELPESMAAAQDVNAPETQVATAEEVRPPQGAEDLPTLGGAKTPADEQRALEMWDQRIAQLEQLQRSAGSRAEAAVLGRLITGLIGTASRYISMRYGGNRVDTSARPYERGNLGTGAERIRQQFSGTIAEQAADWSNRDRLRDEVALRSEQMRQQGQEAEDQRAWREGQLDIRQAQIDARRPLDEARAADLQARTARTDATRQRDDDLGRPDSDVSNRSRAEFEMSLAGMPEDVRSAFADQIARLPELSAREIDMLRADIGRYGQGRFARRDGVPRRGGGGSSSAATDAVAASAQTRLGRLVERGTIDQATADRIMAGIQSPNPRVRREVEAQIDNLEGVHRTDRVRQASAEGGTLVDGDGNATGAEILPGIRTSMDLERGEPRAARTAFSSFRAAMGHLGTIRQLIRQHGGMQAFMNPQVRAQIQRRLVPLRAMVTRIQETGIIQIGEREAIDAELPNPTQMTQQLFQTYMTNLDEWERINTESALVALEDIGVLGQDRERALRLLRAPAGRASRGTGAPAAPRTGGGSAPAAQRQEGATTAPRQASAGEDVIVGRTAGGRTIRIDRSRLPEASRGATIEQLRAAAERRAGEPIEWE